MSNWIDVYVKRRAKEVGDYRVGYYRSKKWNILPDRYERLAEALAVCKNDSAYSNSPYCVFYKKKKIALYIVGNEIEEPAE